MSAQAEVLDDFFNSIGSLLGRLKNAITFTLINFLYSILLMYIDDKCIMLSSTLVLAIIINPHLKELFNVTELLRVTALVWSQNIVNMVTDHNRMFKVSSTLDLNTLSNFTAATVLLVTSSVIGSVFHMNSWIEQCLRMILYMYADSIQMLITLIISNEMIPLICIFSYFLVFRYKKYIEGFVSLNTMVQAMQMVCINLVLSSSVPSSVNSYVVHAGFLLLILLVIDSMSSLLSILKDSREYAMWKVASRLAVLYSSADIPVVFSVVVLVMLFIVNAFRIKSTQTILEVAILTLLNNVVENMTGDAFNVVSIHKSVDAFAYITIFNAVLKILNK